MNPRGHETRGRGDANRDDGQRMRPSPFDGYQCPYVSHWVAGYTGPRCTYERCDDPGAWMPGQRHTGIEHRRQQALARGVDLPVVTRKAAPIAELEAQNGASGGVLAPPCQKPEKPVSRASKRLLKLKPADLRRMDAQIEADVAGAERPFGTTVVVYDGRYTYERDTTVKALSTMAKLAESYRNSRRGK